MLNWQGTRGRRDSRDTGGQSAPHQHTEGKLTLDTFISQVSTECPVGAGLSAGWEFLLGRIGCWEAQAPATAYSKDALVTGR